MITVILVLALIGVLVWFIETYLPMSQPFKVAIRVVVLIFVVLWLVQIFGLDTAIPRLR